MLVILILLYTTTPLRKKIEALHIQTVDQRAADAEENRRQMELFIDMASHELRNPLSGVWQNAEVVQTSLERITDVIDEFADGNPPDAETLEELRREMQENTEAVESIILCASHQGRIADGQFPDFRAIFNDADVSCDMTCRYSQRQQAQYGSAVHQLGSL